MGDYTWQFFRNADKAYPGAFARFDAKAIKLSGASTPTPGEKPPYVTAFENDKADAYVMYCTNTASTLRALPGLMALRIPDALNVRSAYGTGAAPSSVAGERFVAFVLSPADRAILHRHGFN
ncbi:MAG: putative ABC-type molybdate transport system, periplasmic component ModA [Massilia sp.]|jgi:molybdate transport system substrate-binding protein|nr:putative ABC-type molybdate transport system, periplasmic component ModA [Massilia sp.]